MVCRSSITVIMGAQAAKWKVGLKGGSPRVLIRNVEVNERAAGGGKSLQDDKDTGGEDDWEVNEGSSAMSGSVDGLARTEWGRVS